jgi:hypothetical protein
VSWKILGAENSPFAMGFLRKGIYALFPLFGVIYIAVEACKYVQKWAFPVSNFAIGDGKKRCENVVFRRRALGVGFGLSLLASLVAAFMWVATARFFHIVGWR